MLSRAPAIPLNTRKSSTLGQGPQHNQRLDIQPAVRVSPHRALHGSCRGLVRPAVTLGLHPRYPPTRTTGTSAAGSWSVGASPFGGASFGITASNFLLVSETSRNHCRPSPCGRLSRSPRQVVTPATATTAPPHPWPVGRRCAQPGRPRWPRGDRADQRWFPCSLVDRSTEEASDSTPATSPWLPRSTSPRPPLSPADMSGSSPPP